MILIIILSIVIVILIVIYTMYRSSSNDLVVKLEKEKEKLEHLLSVSEKAYEDVEDKFSKYIRKNNVEWMGEYEMMGKLKKHFERNKQNNPYCSEQINSAFWKRSLFGRPCVKSAIGRQADRNECKIYCDFTDDQYKQEECIKYLEEM
jgi:hypothetical protein